MKVTIVGGAGGVGTSTAFNLLLAGGADELVLVDPRTTIVTSHVMDLHQTLEQVPGGTVRGGDPSDVGDADVVVVTAAVPLRVNSSRLAYLDENARILDAVADAIPDGWPGVLVVVTNPVDPLVTLLGRRTRLDRLRVLGYTVNDSLRLRTGIGNALGVEPGAVEAWVLGEHGDAGVPLWSRVRVHGEPRSLAPEAAAAAEEYLRTWYVRHVALDSGRSSTWTSGLGVARMVAAIGDDAGALWPASVVLAGEYGVDGVALTVPITLGARGAAAIHEWELAPAELELLRAAAEVVRAAADRAARQSGPVLRLV